MMSKLSFLLAVVLLIAFAKCELGRKEKRDKVRLDASYKIQMYMNMSVDPCDNFYNFACGNWSTNNSAFDDESRDPYNVLETKINRKLMKILKAEIKANYTGEDELILQFYESCVNIPNMKTKYNDQLKALIGEFGEMPAMYGDQWDEKKFDWVDVVGRIAFKYGIDILLSYSLTRDFTNNTFYRLLIGQPSFHFETKVMYNCNCTAQFREIWQEEIETDLVNFLDLDEKLATDIAHDIVRFEILLAEGMIDETSGLDTPELVRFTTVKKMHKRYAPTINMKRLITLMMGKSISEPIYEYVEQYQEHLKKLLRITPKRTIANYVFYKLMDKFVKSPADTTEEQEENCVADTKQYFDLDTIYYRRYKPEINKEIIDFTWQKIKTRFKKTLNSKRLSWMTEKTRQHARRKLDGMKLKYSYEMESSNEESSNEESFNEESSNEESSNEESSNEESSNESNPLELNNEDFVTNLAKILESTTRDLRVRLYEPPIQETGDSYSPVYSPKENTIFLPISFLQKCYLWSGDIPKSVKFGSMGTTIAHEIMHGFDDSGRKYDLDGNFIDWWDAQSAASFLKRKACFTYQYAHYEYKGYMLPRIESQNENIADNGGLSIAYAAYQDWYYEAFSNIRKERLPKLDFTSKQLFFISYAQTYCSDKKSARPIFTDTHMPEMVRVIGTLANFPDFSKAFNCKAGKLMNRINKCQIY